MVRRGGRIVLEPEGSRVLMLGNEAVARGALEANIGLYAAYPGTPSTEVVDTLASVARETGVHVEYSTNEKVAFEVAMAASWAGLRSMAGMKHVGLNVAADALLSGAQVRVKGGFVVFVADDPGMWSSQNEQDTRLYARMALLPVVEPVSPQEAKDMVGAAMELSEKLEGPVILRTTTRVSHMLGEVTLGPLPPEVREGRPKKGEFHKDPPRYSVVPENARRMRLEALSRLEKAKELLREWPFNSIEGEGKLGVIASGLAYAYVKEALSALGAPASRLRLLKLSSTHPLPPGLLEEFMEGVERVLVVEELEPVVEEQVKLWAFDNDVGVSIVGKKLVPRVFELDTRKVLEAITRFLGHDPPLSFEAWDELEREVAQRLPPRPPTLCPACPHRNTFFSIRKAVSPNALFPSDIGCYSLGLLPPLRTVDSLVDMGASVSVAHGLYWALNWPREQEGESVKPIVATIGDSTFFHTGLPALANAVYNGSRITVVVMDNQVTAMTGAQPHPGVGVTPSGRGKAISIEEVARALGAEHVEVVDPYDIKATVDAVRRAQRVQGVSVIIARRPCSLHETARKRRAGEPWEVYEVVEDKCTGCRVCINAYGCPAISWDGERKVARIDPQLCWGCGGCAQVCPYNAIRVAGTAEAPGG